MLAIARDQQASVAIPQVTPLSRPHRTSTPVPCSSSKPYQISFRDGGTWEKASTSTRVRQLCRKKKMERRWKVRRRNGHSAEPSIAAAWVGLDCTEYSYTVWIHISRNRLTLTSNQKPGQGAAQTSLAPTKRSGDLLHSTRYFVHASTRWQSGRDVLVVAAAARGQQQVHSCHDGQGFQMTNLDQSSQKLPAALYKTRPPACISSS